MLRHQLLIIIIIIIVKPTSTNASGLEPEAERVFSRKAHNIRPITT